MPGVPAAAQMMQLDLAGIAVSAGSACSSGSLKTSHVLAAMGMAEEAAREVIRVSFGPCDRGGDIDALLARMAQALRAAPRGVSAPIYLDYQATTPLAPEAAAAMRPWLEEKFANPHSPHKLGREAAAAVEVAREQVTLPRFGGSGRRVRGRLYFTSGATEALNWALKGDARVALVPEGRRRIVTVATEHAGVLDSVEWLAAQGAEVDHPAGRPRRPGRSRGGSRRAIDGATGLVAAMLRQ